MRVVPVLALVLASACSDQDYEVSLRDLAPTAEITSPLSGADVIRGAVTLNGVVADDRDAAPSLSVEWRLDDALLGAGSVSTLGAAQLDADLSQTERGLHTVSLVVTDLGGQRTTASIDIVVMGLPGAPDVLITTPDDGASVSVGSEVTFRGTASDEDSPATALLFRWSSDVDGALDGAISADGASVLFYDGLSVGSHLITLAVEDEDGEVGEDAIVLDITEEPVIEDPVIAEPGDLVFTELMINPQVVVDEVGEWVELYNTSGSPIDVAGYTFRDDDDDSWVLDGPFIVPPHGYFVLCADINPALNGGVICDGGFNRSTQGDGMALANRVDEVVLSRPDGVEIGRINYDASWFTTAVATGVDPAVLGTPAQLDKTQWCDQVTLLSGLSEPGTPGQQNDGC